MKPRAAANGSSTLAKEEQPDVKEEPGVGRAPDGAEIAAKEEFDLKKEADEKDGAIGGTAPKNSGKDSEAASPTSKPSPQGVLLPGRPFSVVHA